jgi:hypothetical protein
MSTRLLQYSLARAEYQGGQHAGLLVLVPLEAWLNLVVPTDPGTFVSPDGDPHEGAARRQEQNVAPNDGVAENRRRPIRRLFRRRHARLDPSRSFRGARSEGVQKFDGHE